MKKVSISEEDRLVCPLIVNCGYIGENRFEKLEFVIPEEYKKYNKKLNFRLKDGTDITRLFDEGTDNIFTITSDLATYDVLSCCVVFFSIENDDEIIGKSSIFKIRFDKTIPDEDISDYEPKVVILDGLINRVTELEKTITENEKEREEYIDNLKQRVDDGEFNGKDALINGVNTLHIIEGDNISLEQTGSDLKISSTYKYDDTDIKSEIDKNKKAIESNANAISKNTIAIGKNTTAINENKSAIENNTTAIEENKNNIDSNTQDIDDLKRKSNDNENNIDEINENLKKYSLITETGNKIDLTIDSNTYVMTLDLKDKNDNVLSTGSIDLPIESMIINVTYDGEKEELIFTLQSGNEIEVPLNDLISGLVTNKNLEDILKNYALIKDIPTKVSDLENDENYVKNTDYATTNIGGVFKINIPTYGTAISSDGILYSPTRTLEQYNNLGNSGFISKGTLENVITGKNLESANNKVTSIGTSSTDEQYPSAKCVYKIKDNLDNLKNEVLETGEASDTYITLNDSAMAEMQELQVEGVCEQETTTGANLCDLNVTQNDKVVYNSDGTITINGTGGFKLNFSPYIFKANTTYYMKWELISGSTNKNDVFMILDDSSRLLKDTFGSFKFDSDTIKSSFWIHSSALLTDAVIRIWFSTSQTPYEPYTGGIASPNPDYPQEIKTVEGNINLTSCNKNLFDKNDENMFLKDLVPDNAGLVLSGTTDLSAKNFIRTAILKCKPNTIYTISKLSSKTFYVYDSEELPSINYQMRMIVNTGNDKSKYTFTTSQSAKYILFKFFNTWANELYSYDEIVSSIQIEEGQQTSLEQHLQSQIIANLPAGEFIGDIKDVYKDRLYVDLQEDGKYHLILNKMIGKIVLNGNETTIVIERSSTDYIRFTVGKVHNILVSNVGLSNRFFVKAESETSNTLSLYRNNNVYIWLDKSIASTVEEFRTWLSTHNVDVYYPISTPYMVDLGIVDMPLSYDEITNIFTDSDLLPKITAKYYKDFEKSQQNRIKNYVDTLNAEDVMY